MHGRSAEKEDMLNLVTDDDRGAGYTQRFCDIRTGLNAPVAQPPAASEHEVEDNAQQDGRAGAWALPMRRCGR